MNLIIIAILLWLFSAAVSCFIWAKKCEELNLSFIFLSIIFGPLETISVLINCLDDVVIWRKKND